MKGVLKFSPSAGLVPETLSHNDDLNRLSRHQRRLENLRTGSGPLVCTTEPWPTVRVRPGTRSKSGLALPEIDLIPAPRVRRLSAASLSCQIGERLGLSCPAFDINAACSGFLYALEAADGFIASGKARRVLILCAEMLSRLTDWTDRSTCVLFGDGAAACIAAPGEALKYLHLTSRAAPQS
jgi:3-oxoacyl-[acyl-carrier-protein] synthase-3